MADLKTSPERQALDRIESALERGVEQLHDAGVEATRLLVSHQRAAETPGVANLAASAVIAQVRDFDHHDGGGGEFWADVRTSSGHSLQVDRPVRLAPGKYRAMLFVLARKDDGA